ncbi:MAG: DUF2079 domain-containing protein, partial [Dehalococcoidia bacterium]|nr:DUF2079 domain-containing protein [Dehalococcoidia bacterium]
LALALIVFLFSLYAVGRDNPIGHFLSAGDLTPRPNRAALEEAARLIPPEASLATSNMLGARFTHRRQLFFFPVLPFSNQPARIDYFLVDVTDWDLGLPGGMRGQLEQAAPAAEYQTLLDKEGIVLLQRR